MAVTATEQSQDLTNRIKEMIYLERQEERRRQGRFENSSLDLPSPVQETKNFARLFYDNKNNNDLEESVIDFKKVKKIEFS
jgi:hypothetical protein